MFFAFPLIAASPHYGFTFPATEASYFPSIPMDSPRKDTRDRHSSSLSIRRGEGLRGGLRVIYDFRVSGR